MSEPTEAHLIQAIKKSLDRDGSLGRIKAELRAAVMAALTRNFEETKPPQIPDETKLVNELIKEYFDWNGYKFSEQILAVESGQKSQRLSRDALTSKFGVVDDNKTAKIPLLYYIIAGFKDTS